MENTTTFAEQEYYGLDYCELYEEQYEEEQKLLKELSTEQEESE